MTAATRDAKKNASEVVLNNQKPFFMDLVPSTLRMWFQGVLRDMGAIPKLLDALRVVSRQIVSGTSNFPRWELVLVSLHEEPCSPLVYMPV